MDNGRYIEGIERLNKSLNYGKEKKYKLGLQLLYFIYQLDMIFFIKLIS